MDTILKARATLVGLARLNILSARTKEGAQVIPETGEATDYREPLSERFRALILEGNIRTDAMWDRGAESELVALVEEESRE